MSPSTLAFALAQLAAFVIPGWLAVRIAARPIAGRPERALMAVVVGVAVSVALMVAHIVTGGAVFGRPGVVPILLAILCIWSVRRRPLRLSVPGSLAVRVAFAGAVLAALYAAPALIGGSSIRTGDPPWHLGWTEQLLAGDPVPTGPAPSAVARNAYPWGYHAVLATMTRAVPGSDPATAHEAVHLLLIAAIPLAAAAIARRLHPRAGWAAAAMVGLVGGFGWLQARGADLVTSPSNARYGADLVVASPNTVYELFPPPLPRELGLVLLGAVVALVALAVERDDRRIVTGAGAVAGLVGLVSVPLFAGLIVSAGFGFAFARRARWAARALVPAVVVFALWAGPVVAEAARHGGFVSITPRLGLEWPLHTALLSWGLLLPLALAGIVWAVRSASPDARVVTGFAAGGSVVLALSIVRAAAGWDLAGNATLLHQGRVWPPLHLLGAALAGVAVVAGHDLVVRVTGRAVALAATGAVVIAGGVSPALASVHLTHVIAEGGAGFVYARADLEPVSFVRDAAERLSPDDVVDVGAVPPELAFLLFQFSGVRLVSYDDPRLAGNDLRIRYRDLARAWQRGLRSRPTHVVVPGAGGPETPGELIVTGTYEGATYLLIRTKGN